jgi:phthiocerol/phenolphthiocerol synthesis type-I polyketide synthase C
MDAAYWFENIRRPVLFAQTMERAFAEGVTHVVEISPHPVLTVPLEQVIVGRATAPALLSTLRRDAGSPLDLAGALARAYAAGLEPFGRLPRRSAVSVPTYPWQRRRFWPAPGRQRTRAAGLAVSLGPAVAEPDVWSGALELSTADSPWLGDHRVHDAVVVPGMLMLELAVRTAAARNGKAPQAVSGVAFLQNLALGEDPAELSVRWRDEGNGGGGFTLASLPPGATEWTTHARARILPPQAEAGAPPAFPGHLLAAEPRDAEAFYAACAERGLNYGTAFQGVLRAYPGDGEALGEVRLSERCRSGPDSPTLHSALWDAALQVALPLAADTRTAVPTGIRRVLAHREFDGSVREIWAHAVAREEFVFDIFGFDAERRPLFTIEGLRLTPLEQAGGPEIEERVHRLVFAEDPSGEQERGARPERARGAGGWLVCAAPEQAADARELVAALAAASTRAEAATDPAGWPGLLAAGEWTGAVFLAADARQGLDLQRGGLAALTELVRAAVSAPAVPRLAVVTRGALAADPAAVPDPGAALYWGYGRTLRREHPETESVLLDLAPDEPDWAQACAAELLGGHEDDQVLLRAGGRQTGRLVRGEDSGPRPAGAAWRTPAQPLRLGGAGAGLWVDMAWRPLLRRPPGPDQIELEVEACGLNFIDVMKSLGVYPDTAAGADLLGGECVGRVTAVGDAVNGLAVGDRVVACAFGALASHVLARAGHARRIPDTLSGTDAAAMPMVLCTAWYGLNDVAGLSSGETVLVHSAAGGLGLAALQVARVLGAEVIATAGTEEKRSYLRGLGIRHVFDSRGTTWAEDVREATGGRGVDAVLNSLAGVAIDQGLDVLAEDGRFIEVGKKDVFSGRSVSLAAFAKGITLAAVDLAGLLARRPQRFARLFNDVWDLVEQGSLGTLPTAVYPFGEAVEALRTLSRGSHIGKFALHDPATAPAAEPEPLRDGRLRPDATYLITGGLGALGLSLAERFAALGAGSLLLLGRSAPAAEAAARIEALRSGGTPVRTAQVDVADRAALESVLAQARLELPPLRGVVHAAGLLDDATILTMTPGQLEHVLAPKIDGARHLDAATAADRLDLFVLFSSATTLLGNPGQAAYCAANSYLDALAEARRARGLPGLSVQWGPFADIGLAAADEARGARLAGHGMDGFTAAQAWDALEHFLGRDRPVVSYVPLDLRRWFDGYPDTAALASWAGLREAARAGGGRAARDGALTARLRSADQAERRSLLEDTVRAVAGQVLRLDPGLIEGETPFKSLGLDSLMGLELRNRLEAALGLALSPTLLWTYGNILALSGRLAEQFAEIGEQAAAEARQPQEAVR